MLNYKKRHEQIFQQKLVQYLDKYTIPYNELLELHTNIRNFSEKKLPRHPVIIQKFEMVVIFNLKFFRSKKPCLNLLIQIIIIIMSPHSRYKEPAMYPCNLTNVVNCCSFIFRIVMIN